MKIENILRLNLEDCSSSHDVGAYEANGLDMKTKKTNKKKKNKLDESNIIKTIKTFLIEDANSDLQTILKTNGKSSKDYYKYVDDQISKIFPKKMKWGQGITNDSNKSIDDFNRKRNLSFKGGMEDILYDWGVNDDFKDRFASAVKGDLWGGNKTKGDGVYGEAPYEISDFPQEFLDAVEDKAKRYYDEYQDMLWLMGTDPILLKTKKYVRNHIGQKDDNKIPYGVNENINKNKMKAKKITFNDIKFLNEDHVRNLIPDDVKKDGQLFEMYDGVNSYKMRWDTVNNIEFATLLNQKNEMHQYTSLENVKSMIHFDRDNNFVVNRATNLSENENMTKMLNNIRYGSDEAPNQRKIIVNENMKNIFDSKNESKMLTENIKEISTEKKSIMESPDFSWTENYNLNSLNEEGRKMQTTSNEFRNQVKDYIENQFDDSGYDNIEGNNIYDKIWNTFKSEYGWAIKRLGEQKAFTEWLSGLPSILSIDHYYDDVNTILDSWGLDSSKYDDGKSFDFFLYLIYREVNKMKSK